MSQILLKERAAPATPSTDKVSLYVKTDKSLYMKDDAGVETQLGGKDAESKSIIIENPTASEDLSFFFTDVAITITKIRVILTGTTPSVTWTIRHGTDRSATGSEVVTGGTATTDTTTGSDITSFDDATIVANSHVWVETTAQSGTVASIIITVFFSED
jgi:hypothetical protein